MSASSDDSLSEALRSQPYFESIDLYHKLFSTICDKMSPVIGEMTLKSIISNMLDYVAEKHPCFADVEQEGDHIVFSNLQDTQVPEIQEQTLEALASFFDEFIKVMGDLTSNFYTDSLRELAAELLAGDKS